MELCEEQKLPIPRAFMRIALSMMRRSVRRRASFSIDEVSPLDVVPGSFIPALFGEYGILLKKDLHQKHLGNERQAGLCRSVAWREIGVGDSKRQGWGGSGPMCQHSWTHRLI